MVVGRNQFSSDVEVEAFLSDKTLTIFFNCVLIWRIRILIINISRNPQICLQSSALVCFVFDTDTLLIYLTLCLVDVQAVQGSYGINASCNIDKTWNLNPANGFL